MHQKKLKKKIFNEIKEIEEWLSKRPSASMDPAFDEVQIKIARLFELKRSFLNFRPPSKMMDAQNNACEIKENNAD